MSETNYATSSMSSRAPYNDSTTPSISALDITTLRYKETTNATVGGTRTRNNMTTTSPIDATTLPDSNTINTRTMTNSSSEYMITSATRHSTERRLTDESTRLEMSTAPNFTTVEGANSTSFNHITTQPVPHDICYSRTTLFIVSGVSGGVVLLVVALSLICCLRLRHKWRSKLSLERERTDIWSMRTYNNTIINDNFMDYQLASPTTFPSYKSSTKNRRKSSGLSEHSVRIIDPLSRRSSRKNSSEENIAELRHGSSVKRKSYDQQYSFDDSTLRRNTYSAPGGLDAPIVTIANTQNAEHLPSNRERALTYSAGKKHKVDRHVLLTHEEFVEDDSIQEYGGSMPDNSYFVTEL